MKTTAQSRLFGFMALAAITMAAASQSGAQAQSATMRGWLTDEACARGRANSGKFTGGNPDCARKCVAKGEKIVLAVPEEKKLLLVANPELAKSNVGNYVEIAGAINAQAQTVEIKSVTLLEEGRATCALPRKKK